MELRRVRSTAVESPLVVSVETDLSNENCKNFIKSVHNNDWDYEIIGHGHEWKNVFDKVHLYYNYLKTIDPEKLVVLSDSRDVFCVRPPIYFKKAFDSFNKPIVISLELFCQKHSYDLEDLSEAWQSTPINKYWKESGAVPNIRKYVNSGLIAGKAKDLIQFLDWAIKSEFKDDQLALCIYTNTFPERIAADIDARLLHTSGYGVNIGLNTHKQWVDSPSISELTGRLGFFLHLPGIEVSMGQKKIYDLVKTLILDMGISSKWFHEGYSYPPPLWDKGFDEEPRPKNT